MWSLGNEPAPGKLSVEQQERQVAIEAWNSVVDDFFDREGARIANTTTGTVDALRALKAHILKVMRK